MTHPKFLPIRIPLMAVMVTLLLLSFTLGHGQDVAQWRGPDRDGIYNETFLLDEWPDNGPQLLWVYHGLGRGYAAPAVLNDKIYINGEENGDAFLFSLNTKGDLLWKSPNGKEFEGTGYSSTYPGARSTPTVIRDLVYTCSGKGRIACFDAVTGVEIWSVEKVKNLGGIEIEFGDSESLAVDEEKVYCSPGGLKNNLVALDRFNGTTVWKSEVKRDTFSYCSPTLVDLQTRKIIVSTSRHYLYSVDCSNGKLLGSYKLEGFEWEGDHCNTPIHDDGYIYFIGSEEKGKGAIKLALTPDGESIKEVWYNKAIRNNFGGFLKVGNTLFTTIRGNWLKALELNHGTVVDSVKIADGSLIYADHKFICYGTSGTVSLVNYRDNKFEVGGTFKINQGSGQHFSHPVLSGGVMYLRHGEALMAYKVK